MKNFTRAITLFIAITLFSITSNAENIFNESFSSSNLPSAWTNVKDSGNVYWLFKNTPSFSSTSGSYYAVFDDEAIGAGTTGNIATLTTPYINCTNHTNLYISFEHFWYGVENTSGIVEISVDSGTVWTNIASFANTTRGDLSAAQKETIDVTSYAANELAVMFRFRYSDGGQAGKYWYIDDINVYSGPDAGIIDISAPTYQNCGDIYSSTESVSVLIYNFGGTAISNIPIYCDISDGATASLSGTYSGTIEAGDTAEYTFSTTIDLTPEASYTFTAYTKYSTDAYLYNDTLIQSRYSKITSFPYNENFNTNDGGWEFGTDKPDDIQRTFEYGELPYLNGAEGEGNSWFINVSENNSKSDNIWIESPVFDLSALTSPILYFDLKHQIHYNNYCWVEYSTNGTTWTKLGTYSEPHWYNHSSGYWRSSTTTAVETWTKHQHSLCNLIDTCVQFRIKSRPYYNSAENYYFGIDNISIIDGNDVGITSFIDPLDDGCLFSTTQNITVEVYNYGCTDISSIPVNCAVSGALSSNISETISTTITPGTFYEYSFLGTFDMTAIGDYTLTSYTELATDINTIYDTSTTELPVEQIVISSFPYLEDNNTDDGYWITGSNSTTDTLRRFSRGNLPYLNGAEGEGSSWFVDPTISGNSGTEIFITSPVFDFSNTTGPVLSMDIKYQLHNSNYAWVEYSTNGGTNWTRLGEYNADSSWYHNSTGYWRNNLVDTIDTWTHVEYTLDDFSGNSCVKFRVKIRPYYASVPNYYFAFDNFAISSGIPDDVEPISISLPNAGTTNAYSNAEAVSLVIANNTSRDLYNIPVEIVLSGAGNATITDTVVGPLESYSFYVHTFADSLDMSNTGTYTLSATTYFSTDTTSSNDNISEIRYSGTPITTFPYLEDFDNNNGGWAAMDLTAKRIFRRDTVPYLNGEEGNNKSVYIDVSTIYNNVSDVIIIESPVFDLSSLQSPVLSLDIKHQIHYNNYVWFEYSNNNGTSWTKLGTYSNPSWYNHSSNYWRSSTTDPVSSWTTMQHDLCNLIGDTAVKFRIKSRPYYNSAENYYFAFDNFEIKDGSDISLLDFVAPVDDGCLFSDNQMVTVTLYNHSCVSLANIPIYCNISGAITQVLSDTVTDSIQTGTPTEFTFSSTIDMSIIGDYSLTSYTNLSNDLNLNNDSISTELNVEQIVVSSFPYLEDFNTDDGYWIPGTTTITDTNRRFSRGILPYLNGEEGEGSSWFVDTTISINSSAEIYVNSPVFDFSNTTSPVLSMDIKYQLHNSNYAWVEYSTNGGANWTRLGEYNADSSWYHNSTGYWRNNTADTIDTWTHVEYTLDDFSGNSCVRFRVKIRPYYASVPNYYFAFDNFAISAGETDDITPLSIAIPDAGTSSPFTNNELVTVLLQNNTARDLVDIPVLLNLSGAGTATISETAAGPVPANGWYAYTFEDSLDMSATGTYNLSVTTSLSTDTTSSNDVLEESRFSGAPISSYPYTANFDDNNNGWASMGTSQKRAFIRDTIPYLNGQEGNNKSWYIDGTTEYSNSSDIIWIESPAFDIRGLLNPVISFDIKYQLHYNNYTWIEYSINNGSTWTRLGNASDPDWYNHSSGYWRSNTTTQVDEWTAVQHNLCNMIDSSSVKFRIKARPYYISETNYHFAFDNFTVKNGEDVGVISFVSPLTNGCLYDTVQEITVDVFNWGCGEATNIPINCDISGSMNLSINDTITDTIPAGQSMEYTFSQPINLNDTGLYTFIAYTAIQSDINNANNIDTSIIDFDQLVIYDFPYQEDFNNGTGYWKSVKETVTDTNRFFVLDTVPYLNGEEGNSDSWFIDVSSLAAISTHIWVESPVFDLSNMSSPVLSMDIKYQLDNNNYVWVEYTTNGGTNWYNLGSYTDPDWYNDDNSNYWRDNKTNSVETWTPVIHDLCGLAGQSCVKFRIKARPYYNYDEHYYFAFDNFRISDYNIDAELISVDGCYGSNYPLDIVIKNNEGFNCAGTGENIAIGGVASANREYSSDTAAKAFDGDITTYWRNDIDTASSYYPAILEYDLGNGNESIINKYSIYCKWSNSYRPGTWVFQGNNGSDWTTLDSVASGNITLNSWNDFSFSNTTTYQKYRIYIYSGYSTTSTWVHISELRLFESAVIESITLNYNIDGGISSTDFTGLSIASGETATIQLDGLSIPSNLSYFKVWCSNPNGLSDGLYENDYIVPDMSNWANCNDHCSNAIRLTSSNVIVPQIQNATADTAEDPSFSNCGDPTLENTVWYWFATDATGGDLSVQFDSISCTPVASGIQVSIDKLDQGAELCNPQSYTNVFCSNNTNENDILWEGDSLPANTLYYVTIDGVAGTQCYFEMELIGAIDTTDVTFSENQEICSGESVTIGAEGALSYAWNTGSFDDSITVSPTTTTTYTLTATSTNYDIIQNIVVVVNDFPIVDLGVDTIIMKSQSITLDAGSGTDYIYLWNDNSANQTLTLDSNNLILGDNSIWVEVSVNNICPGYDTIIVNMFDDGGTGIAVSDDKEICLGESVTIWAFGADSYLWSTNESSDSITVSPTTTTPYYLTATAGINTVIDTVNVTVNIPPVVNLGTDTTITKKQNITLDAGSGTNYTYLWSTNAQGRKLILDSTNLNNGANTIWVNVSDDNSCTGSDTIIITLTIDDGVAEMNNGSLIKLYPNPTKGILTLELTSNSNKKTFVEIVNIEGQVIYAKRFNHKSHNNAQINEINLSGHQAGVYFVKIQQGKTMKVEKIIIQ